MITLLQIVVVVFAIFAISRAFLRFKDGKVSGKELAFWIVLWGAAIIVVVLPGTSFFFAGIFGIQRGADFVVYMSIVIIFYLLFKLYVKIDSVEKEITKLVREISISQAGRKKKSK